ncbi:protein kinase [Zavarzinia sp.]|uniref:protein kinase domain-containing protein n=1 Tax=Zavarzinia sp. TaxID=2027920 RepID=UPI003562C34C
MLNGDYRLEALLDSGGMGHVYRARNVHAMVPAAIKVIDPRRTQDEGARAKFLAEAAALAGLQHEAIVRYQTLSYSEEYDCYFLVMELLEGEPLDRYLERHHRLDLPDMRQFKRRVALGLHAAHEKGVIHRDVSPDNIFLVGGRVDGAKIIDFGIALGERAVDDAADGGFIGKLDFASPEQLDSAARKIDRRSDIYSLGLVFYAALAGKPLEMGGASGDIDEARALRDAVPDLSPVDPAYRPLIAWMLQPDAGERPETMRVVAEWEPGRSGRDGRRSFWRRRTEGGAGSEGGKGGTYLAWAGGAILLAGAAATTAATFWDFGTVPLPRPADPGSGDILASEEAAERRRLLEDGRGADGVKPQPAQPPVAEQTIPRPTGSTEPGRTPTGAETSAGSETVQETPVPQNTPSGAGGREAAVAGAPAAAGAGEVSGDRDRPALDMPVPEIGTGAGALLPEPAGAEPAGSKVVALIDVPPAPSTAPPAPPEPPVESLAKRIQTRLKQLGCYRGPIDGNFGPGSRASVDAFYRAAGVHDIGTDPSDDLLALLMAQPTSIVCKPRPSPVGPPPQVAPGTAPPAVSPSVPTPPTEIRVIQEAPAAPPSPPAPSPPPPPAMPDFLPPSQ